MKQLFLQRANARNQSIVLAMVCLVLLFTDIRYTYLQPVRAFAGTLTEPVFWLSELPSRLLEGMRVLSQDRSDRLGEDRDMVDKIEAEKVAASAPEPLKEVVEAATIAQRKRDRADWKDAHSEVSELLDDDLDL